MIFVEFINGDWYWAVKVDGEVYADGEAGSEEEAVRKAKQNLEEWEAMQ